MIENRRGLDLFCHVMLGLGILTVLFPLYVAVIAATLSNSEIFQVPMSLIPGTHLWDNLGHIWHNGVGQNSAPFGVMLMNSAIMALCITTGKIVVSILSAFALVWFRFPLRTLFSG
ncbi:MAG: hypothetical protein XXXJIFNMEKO3_03030 [Candidatus Erwinia impunctatus]|nr:hypothetical protein XXXJIFNMEKO_03030 [Culicoides impunctatus]